MDPNFLFSTTLGILNINWILLLAVMFTIAFGELYQEHVVKPREARYLAEKTLPDNASEERIQEHADLVKRWM